MLAVVWRLNVFGFPLRLPLRAPVVCYARISIGIRQRQPARRVAADTPVSWMQLLQQDQTVAHSPDADALRGGGCAAGEQWRRGAREGICATYGAVPSPRGTHKHAEKGENAAPGLQRRECATS